MTFDEALDEMNADQEPSESIRFMERLRDIYAPTVEMTEEEKNVLVDFKKHWTFTQFINAIEGNYEHNMYFEKVEKTFRKMRADNGYMIDEDKLMLAWLHPETIKIVDE